jgi:hypothetical protein
MNDPSRSRVILGVALTLALIAAGAALGWVAYQSGVAQGISAAAGGAAAPPPFAPYGPYFMGPFGFGLLGCLVPLAFLFLVFSLFRLIIWGGIGHHGHRGWGPGRGFFPEGMREHWRQRMEEWHRQAHAGGSGEPPAQSAGV